MVRWHHRLNGHGFGGTLGVGDGQGGLACCSSWDRLQRVGHDRATELIGNGNPLQCSCLGNPMNRVAWRATVPGVTKGSERTQ